MGLKLGHFKYSSLTKQETKQETKITIESNFQESKIKPYRSLNTGEEDKQYASTLQQRFSLVSFILQYKFQEFTQNLMDDKYIDRHKLIKATEDFELKYKKIITESKDYNWVGFKVSAFNYWPYW